MPGEHQTCKGEAKEALGNLPLEPRVPRKLSRANTFEENQRKPGYRPGQRVCDSTGSLLIAASMPNDANAPANVAAIATLASANNRIESSPSVGESRALIQPWR